MTGKFKTKIAFLIWLKMDIYKVVKVEGVDDVSDFGRAENNFEYC